MGKQSSGTWERQDAPFRSKRHTRFSSTPVSRDTGFVTRTRRSRPCEPASTPRAFGHPGRGATARKSRNRRLCGFAGKVSGPCISRCMDNSHRLRDKTGRRDLGKAQGRTFAVQNQGSLGGTANHAHAFPRAVELQNVQNVEPFRGAGGNRFVVNGLRFLHVDTGGVPRFEEKPEPFRRDHERAFIGGLGLVTNGGRLGLALGNHGVTHREDPRDKKESVSLVWAFNSIGGMW